MRVLVLGSRGMLGRAVGRALHRADHDVISSPVDICAASQLSILQDRFSPVVVINCAGVIPLKDRTAREMAETNAAGPHVVAEVFQGAHVIHVSTDCVFDGRCEERYTTESLPSPDTPYGRTKLAGELWEPGTTTVRTSFIGHEHGLLKWLLRQTGDVEGWREAWWSGSTVDAVARSLASMARAEPQGLVHLATEEWISKYDVLRILRDAYCREDIGIVPVDGPRIYRNLEPTLPWVLQPLRACLQDILT